jgi:hypothetical protein
MQRFEEGIEGGDSRRHRWGMILAGGDGKRLLPLTRKLAGDDRPKLFCTVMRTRFRIWTSLGATTWPSPTVSANVSAAKTDGGQLDMLWRTTVCFRKIDGNWMITHGHNSVPTRREEQCE